jgi:hypothetical protein
LSIPRAADVHAAVTSRIHFACVVASVEIHSTSLLPGPRSSEPAIALSAFSYAVSVASPADLLSSMIFSFSLRTRCATASSRGSAALAVWAAPPVDVRLARLLEARPAPLLDERARDRLAVPLLLLLFVVRRVVPLERLLLAPDALERRDELRPDDEPPELEPEPLLLA